MLFMKLHKCVCVCVHTFLTVFQYVLNDLHRAAFITFHKPQIRSFIIGKILNIILLYIYIYIYIYILYIYIHIIYIHASCLDGYVYD